MAGASAHPAVEPLVQEERSGGVVTLRLNRPEKMNALNLEMAQALLKGLLRAEDDVSVRAVVLAGKGRAFCAGQDLADPAVAPGSDLGMMIEHFYNPLIRAMRDLPKPVVARVNGIAAGAGANLAFAADIVIAGKSAAFAESFARIGLLPDSGGTWMLPRLVGHARAVALADVELQIIPDVPDLARAMDRQRVRDAGPVQTVRDRQAQGECECNHCVTVRMGRIESSGVVNSDS